eukprot:TRINITY_DN11830_c0_g2_i1.p1 TRINITY_DN11830_c0_g2~~TRINITY_DN11830_c0_g2_i1.p1  ORF type:complete len:1304 (+),score=331.94 TRINITY_DN11830_c0_g2_i1:102-3914(+)
MAPAPAGAAAPGTGTGPADSASEQSRPSVTGSDSGFCGRRDTDQLSDRSQSSGSSRGVASRSAAPRPTQMSAPAGMDPCIPSPRTVQKKQPKDTAPAAKAGAYSAVSISQLNRARKPRGSGDTGGTGGTGNGGNAVLSPSARPASPSSPAAGSPRQSEAGRQRSPQIPAFLTGGLPPRAGSDASAVSAAPGEEGKAGRLSNASQMSAVSQGVSTLQAGRGGEDKRSHGSVGGDAAFTLGTASPTGAGPAGLYSWDPDAALGEIGGNFEEDDLVDSNNVITGHLQEDTGAERIARLRAMFEQIDVDGSGSVDQQEFCEALPMLGLGHISEDDARAIIAEVDRNSNGEVEFDDFVRFFDLIEGVTTGENRKAAEVLANITSGRDLAKALKQEKDKVQQHDIYTTGKQRDARARILSLLYGTPVLAPDYTPRRWWDVIILWTVMYHWIVCSLTVIHADLGRDFTPHFTAFEAAASLVLIADIGIIFNTAVHKPGQFKLISDRRTIAWHYLTRYFWLDLTAAVPLDLALGYWNLVSDWRWLRVLRLAKLVKPFKKNCLFPMTERGVMDAAFVRFYCWYIPLMRTAWNLVFWAHALGIGRMLVAPVHDNKTESECASYGLDRCQKDPMAQWAYALFWMWALTIGQGLAALESTGVFAFAALVFLVALLVQGHVMAQMSAIWIKSNVKQMKVDSMRSVLGIMHFYGIPEVLQREVLSFNHHTLEQNAVASLAEVLQLLPQSMQAEVGLFIRVKLVSEVPMFRELSTECRLALAGCLQQVFAEPEESIINIGDQGSEMYFIIHGFAEVVIPMDKHDLDAGEIIVATVKRGDFFGEVALLMPGAPRTATIRALTYCDLFRLGVDDFVALFDRFAELSHKMEAEARNRGLLGTSSQGSRPPTGGQSMTTCETPLLAHTTPPEGPEKPQVESPLQSPTLCVTEDPSLGERQLSSGTQGAPALGPESPLNTVPLKLLPRHLASPLSRSRSKSNLSNARIPQRSIYQAVHLKDPPKSPRRGSDGSAPPTPTSLRDRLNKERMAQQPPESPTKTKFDAPRPAPGQSSPHNDDTKPVLGFPGERSPDMGGHQDAGLTREMSGFILPPSAGPEDPNRLPPTQVAKQQRAPAPQPQAPQQGAGGRMFRGGRGGRGRGGAGRGRGRGPLTATAFLAECPELPQHLEFKTAEATKEFRLCLDSVLRRLDRKAQRSAELRTKRCQDKFHQLRMSAIGLADLVENTSRRALQRMQQQAAQQAGPMEMGPAGRRQRAGMDQPTDAFAFARR